MFKALGVCADAASSRCSCPLALSLIFLTISRTRFVGFGLPSSRLDPSQDWVGQDPPAPILGPVELS